MRLRPVQDLKLAFKLDDEKLKVVKIPYSMIDYDKLEKDCFIYLDVNTKRLFAVFTDKNSILYEVSFLDRQIVEQLSPQNANVIMLDNHRKLSKENDGK